MKPTLIQFTFSGIHYNTTVIRDRSVIKVARSTAEAGIIVFTTASRPTVKLIQLSIQRITGALESRGPYKYR
jgi:hypothetical protein